MIVGRIVYAGSKLSLSNAAKNTALWELCGVAGEVDVEKHCYQHKIGRASCRERV